MKNYVRLLTGWVKILSGKCYYHMPQPVGKIFKPGELAGYFNDLTGKTKWDGLTDDRGIILNKFFDGSIDYSPITIIHKGLGHHDLYLLTGEKKELENFIKICDWLVEKQDAGGGWEIKKAMRLTGPFKYSAMSQGEAISALTRAWKLTGNNIYIETAKKGLALMLTDLKNGGAAYYKDDELYLEEYPAAEKNTVLNGWIFALFGIYDYFLATADEDVKRTFYRSFSTLKNSLHKFDSGYWSLYDEKKALASPFYHDLHINQLESLFMVTGDPLIKERSEKWKMYRKDFFKRNYVTMVKIFQKLKNPEGLTVVD
ncbi:MAG: D-glucuronyl C5-epimerase family protein [Candidatus Omnitrophica bacterium]|nr:D-glucuronyl C5-epimerase family protein [Candidatus Omnitrophota bacterium]